MSEHTSPVLHDVVLTGVTVSAAVNALIAIERWGEVAYEHSRDELASIVLPLRAAMDEAVVRSKT